MLVHILGYTISVIWLSFWIFLYILFAFWPANVAARKGYSFFGFFLLSLFFFVITLIVAYMLPDKTNSTPAAPTAVE